ncbi:virulence factor TspB C-terminal domain-related protein [Eikenella corrodens]|nr:virulence factor TspB C-terminal domain-related protein [Eikenella corrodens]
MNELRKISTVLRAVRLTIWAGRTPRHDRLFLHWLYRCAVAILAVVAAVQVARADVPPAYPPQNTPAIQQMAQAPNGYVLTNNRNGLNVPNIDELRRNPRATFTRATPSLGQRSHPVQLTDNYGNVARGQVQTQTQIPGGAGGSVMNKAITGLIVGDMAGKVMNSHGAQNAAKALAEGNYSEAALSAGSAFDVFDIGSGFNSLRDIYREAQDAKSQRVITEAEQAKAQAQQKYDPSVKKVWVYYLYYAETGQNQVFLVTPKAYICCGGIKDSPNNTTAYLEDPTTKERYPVPPYNYRTTHIRSKYVDNSPELYYRAPTLEDLLLTNAEMQQILMQQLADQNSALNKNTEAMTQLINALWAGGHLGPGNTQTMVSGSPADNTFLTSPYTPAGSNQAQQTQFTINNNGTVTQTIVNRPDLAANTSQAPTRTEVGQSQQQAQDTRPAKENSSAEKPDICAQNPNSLMCAEAGNADYTDPVIPEKQIDFDFKPANIFSNDGVCPQPVTFEIFSKSYQLSYEPTCRFLRGVRPIVILAAMVTAMIMAYNAVKEL